MGERLSAGHSAERPARIIHFFPQSGFSFKIA